MIGRVLPERIDNAYQGSKIALWLFVLVLVMKGGMGLNSIFSGYRVASSADGIPLDTFPPAAAQTVVSLFALWGLAQAMFSLLGILAILRYRAMVPLMFAFLLLEHLSRKLILQLQPVVRAGTAAGYYVNLGLLAVMLLGLVLSLWRPRLHPSSVLSAVASRAVRSGLWVCVLSLVLAGFTQAAPQDLQAKRAEWTQRLADKEPARRRGVLSEIVMWDPALEETYDLVFQGLSDPDVETRIEAGEILVRTRRDARALADLVNLAGPTQDKSTRIMALMAIMRVPEGAVDALDSLRFYVSDPDVGHVAQRVVEAVEGRQAWIAAQRPDPASTTSAAAPTPSPTPSAARGPGGELWLGLLALGYGVLTIGIRVIQPDRLRKLEAMKERWGDETGNTVHLVAYTVVPILVGLVLIAMGLRG